MTFDFDQYLADMGIQEPTLLTCPCVCREKADPACELCNGSGEITDDLLDDGEDDDLDDE